MGDLNNQEISNFIKTKLQKVKRQSKYNGVPAKEFIE